MPAESRHAEGVRRQADGGLPAVCRAIDAIADEEDPGGRADVGLLLPPAGGSIQPTAARATGPGRCSTRGRVRRTPRAACSGRADRGDLHLPTTSMGWARTAIPIAFVPAGANTATACRWRTCSTASRRSAARAAARRRPDKLPGAPKRVAAERGRGSHAFREQIWSLCACPVIPTCRNEECHPVRPGSIRPATRSGGSDVSRTERTARSRHTR